MVSRKNNLYPKRRSNALIFYCPLPTDSAEEAIFISIPPKYAVAQVVGYIKGKSAIHIARKFGGKARNFVGENFWARGYFVSTVGRDEQVIREYIRKQESEDRRLDQLQLPT